MSKLESALTRSELAARPKKRSLRSLHAHIKWQIVHYKHRTTNAFVSVRKTNNLDAAMNALRMYYVRARARVCGCTRVLNMTHVFAGVCLWHKPGRARGREKVRYIHIFLLRFIVIFNVPFWVLSPCVKGKKIIFMLCILMNNKDLLIIYFIKYSRPGWLGVTNQAIYHMGNGVCSSATLSNALYVSLIWARAGCKKSIHAYLLPS